MKKTLFVLSLISLCVFCTQDAQSQSSRYNWGLGISPGAYSFYALEGTNIFNGEAYGSGVELSLMRYLNKSIDLGFETNFARLAHPADDSSAANAANGNYGYRQNFITGHIGLRFRFDNGWLMDENSNFVPFLKAGLGGASYGSLSQWSIYLPVGLGFHIHIPKTPITITAQSNYNPMFLLPENTTPSGYLHHSIGLSLQLGKRAKKTDNTEFLELAQSDNGPKAPDRDYDGVPDEIDQCPDIYGSDKTVGCPDTDEDGIKDTEDKCPENAGFANLQGCMDSDYDGVIDPEDDCPDVYGENEYGCPGSAGGEDRDGDGVKNEDDACPDEAGLFTAGGCPDADGDGIQDALDICPDYYGTAEFSGCPMPKDQMDSLKALVQQMKEEENFASKGYNITDGGNTITDKFGNKLTIDAEGDLADKEGTKITTTGGYKVENGEIRDQDGNTVTLGGDGNLYVNGESLDTKENLLTFAAANPDPSGFGTGIRLGNYVSDKYPGNADLKGFQAPVRMTPEEEEYCQRLDLSQLRAAIYFEYDAATPNSIATLSRIVEAMRKCAILELQVAGHTDSDGSDVYNLELSERRAKAVLRYINGEGISDKRLKFNAYGEKYPIAPNAGDGKNKNRRAEVRVQRAY